MAGESAVGGEAAGADDDAQVDSGATSRPLADVWRSDDGGVSWTQLPAPPWPARRQASAVALPNGAVVICAGWLGAERSYLADLWRSDDGGVTWDQLPTPEWLPRYGACLLAQAHGSMAIMGGESFGVFLNDAWRSSDGGHTWRDLPQPPWPSRVGACAAALRSGAVLVLAGHGDGKFLGDVWRTTNSVDRREPPPVDLLGDKGGSHLLAQMLSARQQARNLGEDEEGDGGIGAVSFPSGSLGMSEQGLNKHHPDQSVGTYHKDDAVEFLTASHEFWMPATVKAVDSCGRIMLSEKPDVWISLEDQAWMVRPSLFSTRPGHSRLTKLVEGLNRHDNLHRSIADYDEQRKIEPLGQSTGCYDKDGRWWSATPRWVERYKDALSPEMSVSVRSHQVPRRPQGGAPSPWTKPTEQLSRDL